jgi:hypothetical protein
MAVTFPSMTSSTLYAAPYMPDEPLVHAARRVTENMRASGAARVLANIACL